MDFKRSLWGYSADEVMRFLEERSMAFQARKQALQNDWEAISRTEQELEQLHNRLQIQHDQAKQQQIMIESAKPILDLFLNLCQDYVSSQGEVFMRGNASLLAEIARQTDQIDEDQNKLNLFWQTLHANLGNLINAVELEESIGKSLLSKYTSDLENRTKHLDLDSSRRIQHEPLSANDKWSAAQPEPQIEIDRVEATEHEPLPSNDKWSVVQPEPQTDIDRLGATGYEPLPANDKWNVAQPELQTDIDRLGATGYEPLPANDKWSVVQPEPQTDIDRLGATGYEPLPANDKWRVAQLEPQTDIDKFSVTLPVFDDLKATRLESALAHEDNGQVDAENKSLMIDHSNNVIEPEQQTLQTMTASSKQQALIMDDDATILAMLRIILERDGFSIIECTEGYQATHNIDRIDPPLLAILEANSQNMSGLELIRKIRNKPEWNHCSIILLTENSSEQEIADFLEAGANDYINKPVNTRELVSRIRKLTGVTAVAL